MYNTGGSVRIPVMVPNSILPVHAYSQQDLRLEAALNFTLAGANFSKDSGYYVWGKKNNFRRNKSSHTLTIKVCAEKEVFFTF